MNKSVIFHYRQVLWKNISFIYLLSVFKRYNRKVKKSKKKLKNDFYSPQTRLNVYPRQLTAVNFCYVKGDMPMINTLLMFNEIEILSGFLIFLRWNNFTQSLHLSMGVFSYEKLLVFNANIVSFTGIFILYKEIYHLYNLIYDFVLILMWLTCFWSFFEIEIFIIQILVALGDSISTKEFKQKFLTTLTCVK